MFHPAPAVRVLLIGIALVMLIYLALSHRLLVKLARTVRLASRVRSLPMDDETLEFKGWRRNDNGTYTPISCGTLEDARERSPERRNALGVLRQLRATDGIEGMAPEYLSTLTPDDDPRVTDELVEKAKQAKSKGLASSSVGPRGGRCEMRISSKGKMYRHYY